MLKSGPGSGGPAGMSCRCPGREGRALRKWDDVVVSSLKLRGARAARIYPPAAANPGRLSP